VENRNKHTPKIIVRQDGYLQMLYRDARKTEHKKNRPTFVQIQFPHHQQHTAHTVERTTDLYVTPNVHILTITVSNNKSTIHDKYQTPTCFGNGVTSTGSLLQHITFIPYSSRLPEEFDTCHKLYFVICIVLC
jgi:hypothetical protein